MDVNPVMFSLQGSSQTNHRSKGTRKRKKITIYLQSVFLNICFSCAAVWPDSFIEEQKV